MCGWGLGLCPLLGQAGQPDGHPVLLSSWEAWGSMHPSRAGTQGSPSVLRVETGAGVEDVHGECPLLLRVEEPNRRVPFHGHRHCPHTTNTLGH